MCNWAQELLLRADLLVFTWVYVPSRGSYSDRPTDRSTDPSCFIITFALHWKRKFVFVFVFYLLQRIRTAKSQQLRAFTTGIHKRHKTSGASSKEITKVDRLLFFIPFFFFLRIISEFIFTVKLRNLSLIHSSYYVRYYINFKLKRIHSNSINNVWVSCDVNMCQWDDKTQFVSQKEKWKMMDDNVALNLPTWSSPL